jgi:toxin FitB
VIELGAKLRQTGSDRRAENLRQWLDRVLDDYTDRILAFDRSSARIAEMLSDAVRVAGRYPSFGDVAIAAIAKARELMVVTLNRRHFDPLEVEAFNLFAPH